MTDKRCPQCFAADFVEVREGALPGSPYHYAGTNSHKCSNCGFVFMLPLELSKKDSVKKFKLVPKRFKSG